MVASHFQQMGTNGFETVTLRKPCIGVEYAEQFQPLFWSVHHGCGNGVVQYDHWIIGHAFQKLVERQNLRPVGVLGARRLVMYSRDGGL